ncbi:MAG: AbrB/MazE/SpoVT family DNA-binding domain-containing protein [Bacillota bacterium]
MPTETGQVTGTGRVNGKGQVQIPKEIRDALGIHTGDELVFRLADNCSVVHVRKRRQLSELAGVLSPRRPFQGIDEEEAETKRAAVKRAARKLNNGD